ncbi:MAG TPA: PP2C family protein-serine/threonine phosphatase [Candidatus Elarobacter sp.]
MRNWIVFRFLYGTSGWNAAVLLLLLICYVGLAGWLRAAHVGSTANSVLLGGFVLLLLIGVMLYYGSRQASISRRLNEQTLRADAEHRLTTELQKAFLQQPLPAISNMGFSATYLPAAAQSLVGGDWYDAFELPHGRVMFSLGDVAGHGIEAAVTMTRARQSIIAAALQDSDPGSVLARANEMLLMQDTKFATAICGYIDPGTLEVTYATAGHPPAIFVDQSGAARLLPYDGLPLGVEHGASYPTFKLTAEHDSLLVLYTDGLLEYDRDLIEGERRMVEAARNIAVQRLSNPAGAIEDAIFKNRKPVDDVAILTIAFRDASIAGANADPSENWSIGLRGLRAPYGALDPAE